MIITLTTTKGGGAFVIPHQHSELTKEHFVELQALTLEAVGHILHGSGGTHPGWMDRFEGSGQDGWRESVDNIGSTIWNMFIDKVCERIKSFGIPERAPLLIIPSSGLGLLPWTAACTDEGGQRQYPLADYTVSFCPSINVLRACRARSEESLRSTGNPRMVLTSPIESSVAGDKEYSISYSNAIVTPASPEVSILALVDPSDDLEYARAEGELILSMFGPEQRMALSHHLAWLTALEQWVPGYNYLHFSCHANYNNFDPRASNLRLDGDQQLTFGQIIASLNLYAARLVILSACEFGLTQRRSPDEYLGLGAGFLLAGAPAVVSSLWPVDDASTMLIMHQFYHFHLQEKQSPAQALASAQGWLRSQTNEDLMKFFSGYLTSPSETLAAASQAAFDYHVVSAPELVLYRDPYYWAGFTLTGV